MEYYRLVCEQVVAEKVTISKKIDPYVYVSIRVGDPNVPISRWYWHLVDPVFSLVEIGVEPDTGKLTSVTVPLYNGKLYPLSKHLDQTLECMEGLPIFSLVPWLISDRPLLYEVSGKCRLEIGQDVLRVCLFDEEIERIAISSPLICEFNSRNELCAVRVNNLAATEIDILKSVLPYESFRL